MAMHRYKVLRQLVGDKVYEPGDERVADSAEVAHLVPRALEDLGPEKAEKVEKVEKAESAPANKAETAPLNKAEKPTRKSAKKDRS